MYSIHLMERCALSANIFLCCSQYEDVDVCAGNKRTVVLVYTQDVYRPSEGTSRSLLQTAHWTGNLPTRLAANTAVWFYHLSSAANATGRHLLPEYRVIENELLSATSLSAMTIWSRDLSITRPTSLPLYNRSDLAIESDRITFQQVVKIVLSLLV